MNAVRQIYGLAVCLVLAGSAVASEAVLQDARLDKKVTLATGLVTLDQFAAEMTGQTGVRIEAGSKKSDWKVKERKTIVFAKDVPAKDILLQVAKLHHYTLSGYGEGDKRYYRYWQDMKSRQEEEDLPSPRSAGENNYQPLKLFTNCTQHFTPKLRLSIRVR